MEAVNYSILKWYNQYWDGSSLAHFSKNASLFSKFHYLYKIRKKFCCDITKRYLGEYWLVRRITPLKGIAFAFLVEPILMYKPLKGGASVLLCHQIHKRHFLRNAARSGAMSFVNWKKRRRHDYQLSGRAQPRPVMLSCKSVVVFFPFCNQEYRAKHKGHEFCGHHREPNAVQSPNHRQNKNSGGLKNERS